MKYVFVALLLLATFIYCEEVESYTFASLSWSSTKEEVKKCLIEKGYTIDQELIKTIDNDTVIYFEGEVAGENATISVYFNSNNELCKCVVHLIPEKNKVTETYESLRDILISKYNEPDDNTYKYFEYPYEEGDGHEEQAIQSGKAHYITFWRNAKDNSTLCMAIGEDLDIIMIYVVSKKVESYNFASLSWGSTKEVVKKSLIEKGYTFDQELINLAANDKEIYFKGEVAGENAKILVIFNSNNELVKCAILLHPDENEEIDTYLSLKVLLISKYGETENNFKIFEYPYEDGDGYEEQAIRLGKGHFSAFWPVAKDSSELVIRIAKDLSIVILYKGPGWDIEYEKIRTKEAEDL